MHHFSETTTQKALAKRLVCCPELRVSHEPKVIMAVTYVMPDYLGGGETKADAMVSAKTYYRLMRRAA